MSRIGNKPITITDIIKVNLSQKSVVVEGPSGKLEIELPENVSVIIKGGLMEIKVDKETNSSLQGLYRSLLQNAVTGVVNKWTKTLELSGVGYTASTTGDKLTLNLGFSHPVEIAAQEGITFQVKENKIKVCGADKYLVGEVAASIKRIRPPEPYKGKGIRYEGEYIRKKLGKAAKAVGGAGAK